MKKVFLLMLLYSMAILVAIWNKELFLYWINESTPSQIPLMLFLSILFSVFPVLPFSLFAGVMGLKYGIAIGMMINWVGAVTASVIFFFLSRYSFQATFRNQVKMHKWIKNFNDMIEYNPFFAVFLTRLIPFIPTPLVTIYSGLSSMSFLVYLVATGIGMLPSMIFYAYSGRQLFQSYAMLILGIGVYTIFILLIFLLYRRWYKGKPKALVK